MGCNKMGLRFEEMTGTPPPWTLPACPCGSAADFVTHIEDSGDTEITCSVLIQSAPQNDILEIDTVGQIRLVLTHLPPLNVDFLIKRSCGFDNTSDEILNSDDEAQSCANNIVVAAANFGTTCTGL